jgi:hypothetical protein
MEIMELQAGINTLLRGDEHTPFRLERWQYACLEAQQQIVAMTAIQFAFFEPVGRVKGNDEFKITAEKLIDVIIAQLKTLKTKKSGW